MNPEAPGAPGNPTEPMKQLLIVLSAATLAGCVVYLALPASYYRPAVVVY